MVLKRVKKRKLILLPMLALVAIIAWAIFGNEKSTRTLSEIGLDSITIDVEAPSISFKVKEETNYICLSRAEYEQAYLPSEFQCYDCNRSKETRAVLKAPFRESDNQILLISKLGDEFHASQIDISSLSDHQISPWYRRISYNPEQAQGMSQCTSKTNALATCYQTKAGCLFLFQK